MLGHVLIRAGKDGVQDFNLPASMQPGNHTLVVTGTGSNGKSAMMKLAIVVAGPDSASRPVVAPAAGIPSHPTSHTNAGWLSGLLAAVVLGMILALFWILGRRRRKEEEDTAAPNRT